MLHRALLAVALLMLLLKTGAAAQLETLRLVGSSDPREGRLELYYNGAWGTVCDDNFNNATARVVCYMLRYGHTGRFIGNRYGAGSGQI